MLVSTEGTARASALSLHAVQELSRYWSGVRDHYRCFEPGLKSTSSEVVHHEIPGTMKSEREEGERHKVIERKKSSKIEFQ